MFKSLLSSLLLAGTQSESISVSMGERPEFAEPEFVAAPIPTGEDAITAARLAEKHLPFFRRVLVEPFKAHPDFQKEWGAEALALLEEEARVRAVPSLYRAGDTVSEKAERFVESGAEYPVLKLMWGRALGDSKNHEDHIKAIKLIDEVFESAKSDKSLSPQLRMFLMEEKFRLEGDKIPATARQAAFEIFIEAFTDASMSGSDWTYIAFNCMEYGKIDTAADFLPLLEKAQNTGGVDIPVVALCHKARLAVSGAWKARGGGYANTVTPEGWEKFGIGIDFARDCYEKAWQLRQDLPMVAHGGQGTVMGDKQNSRMWFDRTVSAQMDYEPAYSTYEFYALYPRWCGSLREMREFADECLTTQRFDTEVPLFYCKVISDIFREIGDDWLTVFNDKDALAKYNEVLDKYMPADDVPRTPQISRLRLRCFTGLEMLAYMDYDYEALKNLAIRKRKVYGDNFTGYDDKVYPTGPMTRVVMTRTASFSDPLCGELFCGLDKAMRTEKYDEARTLIGRIRATGEIGFYGTDFLGEAELRLDLLNSQETGEWFDMIPKISNRHGIGAYISYANAISCTNQVFWNESGGGNNIYAIPIPHNVEFRFKARLLSEEKTGSVGFGLDTYFEHGQSRPVLTFDKTEPGGVWNTGWYHANRNYQKQPIKNSYRSYGFTELPESAQPKVLATADRTLDVTVASRHKRGKTLLDVKVNGEKIYKNVDITTLFYDQKNEGRLISVLLRNAEFFDFQARILTDKATE